MDQFPGIRKWQRIDYHGLNQAEHRCIGADTETQDEHRSDGETRRLQKQANRSAKMGHGERER